MSEQQPLSNKEALEQALNAKAEPAWDPIYKEGQEFRLAQIDGLPGVGLEVFPDHEVVRVTTSNLTSLTFPTRAAPHIEGGAVVFTNRHGRLTVAANGEVVWERVSQPTEAPPAQPAVAGSTSDLPRQPSCPEKASEALVSEQQDGSKPAENGQTPRTTTVAPKEERRVELTGRLGRTPTFRTTPRGTFIGKFPLAVHLEDEATKWHTILAFGPRAQKLEQKVTAGEVVKGREVEVIGYTHSREVQGKNGKTRVVREVHVAVVKSR
jgi:Single-strand binding protein family